MYVGHVGIALGAKRLRASIGILVLLVATYAPDWVDTGLCVAGRYNPRGMLSHSFPAITVLALVAFAAYVVTTRDWRSALVVAGVVVSHMLLDWITNYKPTWSGGPMIGLSLYAHPMADFVVEGVVIVIGVLLYLRTLPTPRRAWLDVSMMLGALLGVQLGIDVAKIMSRSLTKC